MATILSDIVTIKCPKLLTNAVIEEILTNKFGEIIRWAVVNSDSDELKISVSYISAVF